MDSRERLLTALEGRQPDRVPISTHELCALNSRAWENQDPSYKRLMAAIREHTDAVAMWNPRCDATVFASAAPVEMETETRRDGAVLHTRRTLRHDGWTLTSATRETDGVHTVWPTEPWCKSPEDVDLALSIPYVPLTFDFSDFARISQEVGRGGIVMATVPDALLLTADLMEFSEFTIWAQTETEHFAQALAEMHRRNMQNLRRMLDAGVVDLYRIVGPEYATPPMLPPSFFERFVVPHVSEMVNLIHAYGSRTRVHCHGRIGQVLDLILATGADALDPCEGPPQGDIELGEIKRRTASRMCLFGNVQLGLLETGTEAEVDETVRKCMDEAKAGGGFVIMPTSTPMNSPLSPVVERNLLRFIESAREYGRY